MIELFDYVSFFIDKDCAEVKFYFRKAKPLQVAAMLEEEFDDRKFNGFIWEQIFTLNFNDRCLDFEDAVLESMYTGATVTFYFDYLDYEKEDVIEWAEEFHNMIIDLIEDESWLIDVIQYYEDDINWDKGLF